MMGEWNKLSRLTCVKGLGTGHKIAHLLGIHAVSKCLTFNKGLWMNATEVGNITARSATEISDSMVSLSKGKGSDYHY